MKLCPICLEIPADYFTECNHSYCIGCLIRIEKCALCRKTLQRGQLCIEIKENIQFTNNTIDIRTSWYLFPDDVNSGTTSWIRIDRPFRLNFNHPVRELIWNT